jgi:chromosome segregation ATPase
MSSKDSTSYTRYRFQANNYPDKNPSNPEIELQLKNIDRQIFEEHYKLQHQLPQAIAEKTSQKQHAYRQLQETRKKGNPSEAMLKALEEQYRLVNQKLYDFEEQAFISRRSLAELKSQYNQLCNQLSALNDTNISPANLSYFTQASLQNSY